MKRLLYILLLTIGCYNSYAQIPGLTTFDLNTSGNSYPLYLTPFNAANGGKICFFADSGGHTGWELYTCDGINRPVLVLDLNPGPDNSVETGLHHPTAVINNKLYFTGNNGLSGAELYCFNGATMPVIQKDIVSGNEGSNPDDYAVVSDILYFRARDNTFGYELYNYSPATNAAPTRLTDINPGPDSSVNGNIIAFNNKIYFTADSGMGNNELYQYEPLSGITIMLADIKPGTAGSFPQNLTVINNKLYFTAEDAGHGRELWMFDGTNPPARATDLLSGFLNGMPSRDETIIAAANNTIYISGKDSTSGKYLLFNYDATAGTATIAPKITAAGSNDPQWLTPFDGKLYFSAFVDTAGYELCSYDAVNGIKMVMDLCPGSNGSNPEQLMVIENELYFKATQCNGTGVEVFKYKEQQLGISNVKFDGKITTYPNPAKDNINISFTLSKAEPLSINFTDVTGKLVYTNNIKPGTSLLSVTTHSWVPGIYYYAVYNASGVQYVMGKIVVQ